MFRSVGRVVRWIPGLFSGAGALFVLAGALCPRTDMFELAIGFPMPTAREWVESPHGIWVKFYDHDAPEGDYWNDSVFICVWTHVDADAPERGWIERLGPVELEYDASLTFAGLSRLPMDPTNWHADPQSRPARRRAHFRMSLPTWLPCLLLAMGPLWAFYRGPWRRRRRRAKGLCAACGYNLTANVTGVCPECGTVVPKSVRSFGACDHTPSGSRDRDEVRH